MNESGYLREFMEQSLLEVHTAFFGRIVSVGGGTCTIQPLAMTKDVKGNAQKRAVIKNVPILWNARNRIIEYEESCCNGSGGFTTRKHLKFEPLKSGDIAFCVCADRDISEQRSGNTAVPTMERHHDITDCVVVGVL